MALSLHEITVEYRNSPIGIGEARPRFSWKLHSEEDNTFQAAYRLRVCGGGMEYDTGRVRGAQSHLIAYEGEPLRARTRYHVFVEVWDGGGRSARGETYFETGLLDGFAERAEMIAPDTEPAPACAELFTEITVGKPVARARAYATALGMYELCINGEKVGDLFFAPFWTDYNRRLEYQTYDIAPFLRPGKNEICMRLAKGWYRGELNGKRNIYGTESAGLAEIHIEYGDGGAECFYTDKNWRARGCFIVDSEIYHGEEQDGCADYSAVCGVKGIGYDKANIVAQINEPCRVTQRIKPVRLLHTPKGEQVLDFGQNLTGAVEFRIRGERGQSFPAMIFPSLTKKRSSLRPRASSLSGSLQNEVRPRQLFFAAKKFPTINFINFLLRQKRENILSGSCRIFC